MSTVEVITPSRLHFGMFSFGRADVRQFGGVGLMIDRPGVHLKICSAERFTTSGKLSQRVAGVVDRLASAWGLGAAPSCQVEVVGVPAEHAGLGTGTQLELGVTAGLNAWRGGTTLSALELAELSGRGARSAIGTYGFLQGGLLVESGKLPSEVLSPLEHRVELPPDWRFVLMQLPGERGLAGEDERRAFGTMPPVPVEVTLQLRAEVAKELLPAALDGKFARFSESLYRFGHLAGSCFAASQGGPFASAEVSQLIAALREREVRGVGQSSWGPTVFAAAENQADAEHIAGLLESELAPQATWQIARPSAAGARILVTKS